MITIDKGIETTLFIINKKRQIIPIVLIIIPNSFSFIIYISIQYNKNTQYNKYIFIMESLKRPMNRA
jgi:hypothetical protein